MSQHPERTSWFTAVFNGDLRAFKTNPHKVETPFGRAHVLGIGDAFAEIDAKVSEIERLTAELKEAVGLLRVFVEADDDAQRNPAGGLSLGSLMDARDNHGAVYQSAYLAGGLSVARAFLSKVEERGHD